MTTPEPWVPTTARDMKAGRTCFCPACIDEISGASVRRNVIFGMVVPLAVLAALVAFIVRFGTP